MRFLLKVTKNIIRWVRRMPLTRFCASSKSVKQVAVILLLLLHLPRFSRSLFLFSKRKPSERAHSHRKSECVRQNSKVEFSLISRQMKKKAGPKFLFFLFLKKAFVFHFQQPCPRLCVSFWPNKNYPQKTVFGAKTFWREKKLRQRILRWFSQFCLVTKSPRENASLSGRKECAKAQATVSGCFGSLKFGQLLTVSSLIELRAYWRRQTFCRSTGQCPFQFFFACANTSMNSIPSFY